ncbi:MAG: PAS domain S-box protein [Methanococcaceae archaeon]
MDLSGKKILLVEDEVILALAQQKWLQTEGFNVLHSLTGEKAIETVQNSHNEIDLILMDIDLGHGRMDGTEAAREILKTHDIPLLFVSSHTEPEIVNKTEQISSYGYVVKGSCNTVLLASMKMAFKLHSAHKELLQKKHSLRESQTRHATIFEHSPISIMCYDQEGMLVSENEACLKMFGSADRNEIARFNLFTDLNISSEIKARLLNKEQVRFDLAFDFDLVKKQNLFKTIHSGTKLFDVVIAPLAIGYIAQLQDITGRRQAEENLLKNEHLLRLIIDHSPSAIAMFDRDMKYIIANKHFLVDYELGEVDLIGRSHYEVFPEISDNWKEIHKRCLAGAVDRSEADMFPRLNGSVDWVTWEIHPWFEDADRIGGIILFSKVITKQKQLENSLLYSNEFLDRIFDSSPISIWISNETGTLIRANRALFNTLHLEPVEITGKYNIMEDNIVEEQGKMPLVRRVFENGESARFTMHYDTSRLLNVQLDAHISLFLDISISPIINQEGRVVNAIIQHIDITESKHQELRLAAYSEELKKLNATKDKLLSLLAHDLRGPFSGFMGLTETLAQSINSLTREEIAEFAAVLFATSKKIFELFTNLLEWSRLQTGRIKFRQEELDIYIEAENIRNLFSSAASAKSISILNNAAPECTVLADSNLLPTILRNLVSNAIKFTHPGGTITIDALDKDSAVEVSVADNGVGMTQETIEKIFRIDSGYTTIGTNGEEGSGLGMALCKELLEKNGSTITVQSEPGNGTTFKFLLPSGRKLFN